MRVMNWERVAVEDRGMRHGYDTIASTPSRKKKPLPKKEIERRAKQRATQKPTRSAGGTRREVS